ncbi:MAG TPA: hypothetical protein PKA33_01795 [Amaricoccus sp.]|uniref:hypothetical protein n=1 Tax=Amaricoccus sp. TaxID=1872485 RepID=UPI002C6560F1|nr:hypothetical protein [Amaricoccus sp.]HMR51172.1 hypothetical protein [Amaricoccus sp.]HMT98080.1 hypothetical protein [Amaricoccus sp.]
MIWATVAAELAKSGLSRLAKEVSRNPTGRVVLDMARALDVDPSPEAVSTALASDPAAIAKLMQYEIAQRQLDEASAAAARKAHAGSWVPALLAVLLLIGVGLFGWALFTREAPAANRDMVNILLGLVGGWTGAAVTFWVGSSRGSVTKQSDLVDEMRR